MTLRALVLRTAGTNCDRETLQALELAGASTELVHLRRLIEEPARLDDCELIVLPGGFSYGDDVAAGRIFGFELREHLSAALGAFVARGGFALGVCNGFQILVESGLLEPAGSPPAERRFSLTDNASARYECRWTHVRATGSACSWLSEGLQWPMPVAHAEGRFVPRDAAALESLRSAGQLALVYATPDGASAEYPDNPNGSAAGVAGVCDPTGRVLGLMPHPERNLTPWNHPQWTRMGPRSAGEGLDFYRRLVEAAGAPVAAH